MTTVTGEKTMTTRTTAAKSQTFGAVAAADGVTIPKIAQLLGIAPIGTAEQHGSDYIYIRNDADGTYSETVARRGGYWTFRHAEWCLLSGSAQLPFLLAQLPRGSPRFSLGVWESGIWILGVSDGLIVALHFIAYPWYAGSSTDFKFMY